MGARVPPRTSQRSMGGGSDALTRCDDQNDGEQRLERNTPNTESS